jgi:hypothetical protein
VVPELDHNESPAPVHPKYIYVYKSRHGHIGLGVHSRSLKQLFTIVEQGCARVLVRAARRMPCKPRVYGHQLIPCG